MGATHRGRRAKADALATAVKHQAIDIAQRGLQRSGVAPNRAAIFASLGVQAILDAGFRITMPLDRESP